MHSHLDVVVQGEASSILMTMINREPCRNCRRPRCVRVGNRAGGLLCGLGSSLGICARKLPCQLLGLANLGIILRFIIPRFCPILNGTQFHQSDIA